MGKLLKGGLILRSLAEKPSDKDRLAEFMHHAFEENGDWHDTPFTAWINELLNTHPMMSLEHVWCIVDPANDGKIVSGVFLIPQVWRYEDIELSVGRPEIVGTLPEYRRRGLVRELFHVLHDYSEKQGQLLQVITGIPHFYRQFGYGFAVELGSRGQIPLSAIPKLGKDHKSKFSLRPAEEADIPSLVAIDAYEAKSFLLSAVHDETMWRYDLLQRDTKSAISYETFMILNEAEVAVGYISISRNLNSDTSINIWRWVIGENANYLETFEDILRALKDKYQAENSSIVALDIPSSINPVVVQLMKRNRGMYVSSRMYAWYLRIPDHVAFINAISPVLERRLIGSSARGYTGNLRINFYQSDDLLIEFRAGKIADVRMTSEKGNPDARFPFDTWLNIVFGANSEAEIQRVLPDTMSTAESAVLLEILFPKKQSAIYAIS